MTEIFGGLSLLFIILFICFPVILFIMFLVLCSNIGRIRKMIYEALYESKKVR